MSQISINVTSSIPRNILAVVLSVALLALTVFGQMKSDSDVRPLIAGQAIEREMKGNEAHLYNVALTAKQFLHIVVEQKGIDVAVTLFDPDGKKLAEVDSPNGTQGPEPLSFIAETIGNYRLEIRSPEKTAAGRYEVKIKELRMAMEKDKNSIAAQQARGEGILLYLQGTKESLQSAITKYEESLRFYRSAEDRNGEAAMLNYFGMIHSRLNENGKALEYFNQALLLYKAPGDKFEEARTLIYIGLLHANLDENRKALEYFNQASLLYKTLGDKFEETRTQMKIGVLHSRLDENRKALEYFNQALPQYRAVGDKFEEARTLINIGVAHAYLGEYKKALDYYLQSLSLSKVIENKRIEATVLNNIASIYASLGEYQKALDYYLQLLPLLGEANEDKRVKAQTFSNIGTVYADLKEYQKALDYYLQALPLYRIVKDRRREAVTFSNIGKAYLNLEENQKALEYFNQALTLHRAVEDRGSEAITLRNIGLLYFKLKENQKALENLNQALILHRIVSDRRSEANTLKQFTTFWESSGNSRLAIFYGKQSVNKYQELRREIQDLSPETQKAFLKTIQDTYQKLADILIAEGRFAEAQQVLSLLKEEEYFQYIRRDADEIKNLKDRVSLKPDEQKLIERYNLFADKVTQIGTEFQKLEDKKRKLPIGAFLPPEEQKLYETLSAQLSDANAVFKLFLEKELVAELGKTAKKEIEIDRALQNKLRQWGNGTVALFTVAGQDRYRVILTTPTAQVDGKTEIKAADLNKKIFAFREALQNTSSDPRPIGKELYDILVKPIEKDLMAANAKTLLWSLDGTLRYIPISALSPDGSSYLVQKYQNVVITSTTRQSLMAEIEKDWKPLGVGVSNAQTVFDPVSLTEKISFASLPGVKTELSAIVKDEQLQNETGLLPGKRFVDSDFNRKNFSDYLTKETPEGKRKYTVVHLASHFKLGSDSADSFLLLGDGKVLTLEQISNSPELTFEGVELVTLSACNTGFGNSDSTGNEVDSLAKFIEERGAKSILATLWSVADESTQLLMSEFYRIHKDTPNLTKAEAMQMAQKTMIDGKLISSGKQTGCRSDLIYLDNSKGTKFKCDTNAPFAHPYFWSPFILIGNWR